MRQFYKYYLIIGLLILLGTLTAQAEVELNRFHKRTIQNIHLRIEAEGKRNNALKATRDKNSAHHKENLARVQQEDVEKLDVDKAYFEYTVGIADVLASTQIHAETLTELDELEQELKRSKLRLQEWQLKGGLPTQERKVRRLEATIEFLRLLISFEEQLEHSLKNNVRLTTQLSEQAKEFHHTLLEEYSNQQNELRERYIVSLNRHVQYAQQGWLKKLSQATASLAESTITLREQRILQMEIMHAEEEMVLGAHKLKLAKLHDKLEDIREHLEHVLSVQSLDGVGHKLIMLRGDLVSQQKKIEAKLEMLQAQKNIQHYYLKEGVLAEKDFKSTITVLNGLEKAFGKLDRAIGDNFEKTHHVNKLLSKRMNEAISRRQGLPGFDWSQWSRLIHEVAHIPVQGYDLILGLYKHVVLNLSGTSIVNVVLAYSIPIILFLIAVVLRHYLDIFVMVLSTSRHRLTSNFFYGLFQIFRRNLIGIYCFTTIISFVYVIDVPYFYYRFFILLAIVWFAYRTISLIARLFLVETVSDVAGDDVRLFKRLNRTLVIGGLITALAALAKELHVAYDVQDLVSRFLMLFMFIVAVVLLKSYYVLPNLFKQVIDIKRLYLLRALNLLAFLIPLNVLIIAVVGLVGYVQLAWRMSYYQILFVVVLTFYVILRGIVTDVMEFTSEFVIKHTRNGWLVSEALLKPIDRIIRLLLVFLTCILLFLSYGWGQHSFVVEHLLTLIYYPFIAFKGGQISLISIFEFGIMLSIVIWATRWAREFSYRLIFTEVRDQGLRKSLATFFQYSVGMIGFIPTLWILGLDFTGLSMIISALAIGIGFGLRDFANNIVSGILLLVERPVKEGDVVSIGGYDGRVTYIGMRSMTVKTWDHMEVMVPNSEAFNKTFTNWTYHDSIVRTTISIKAHRQDDPLYIQSLVFDVLNQIEEVSSDPEPQVLLKELNDSLIEFQVRYFSDINQYSRLMIRSKVLFNVWQRFKACGIRAPYPQQDIKLIEHMDKPK